MRYILFFFTSLLLFCSENPTTGGVENTPNFVNGTNNSTISGSVTNPYFTSSVVLKKISLSDSGASLENKDTTELDGFGNFKFEKVDVGTYGIIIENGDQIGLFSRVNLTDSQSVILKTIKTNDFITLKGRAIGPQSKVMLPELNISTTTDAQGFYILNNIPSGDYDINFISTLGIASLPISTEYSTDTIYLRDIDLNNPSSNSPYCAYESDEEKCYAILPEVYDSSTTPAWYNGIEFTNVDYQVFTGEEYVNATDRNGEKVIEIDTFEDDSYWVSNLEEYSINSYWYGVADDSSLFTKNIVNYGPNHYLDIYTQLYRTSSYAIVGLKMQTDATDHVNLTKLDRIEFKAKGNIALNISLESPIFDSLVNDYTQQPYAIVDISNEWETYTIKPSEFFKAKGYGWDDIKNSINRMEFSIVRMQSDSLYSMSIDNIKFYGVSVADLKED